ncbi:MAG TPA: acyl carrier protein [Polyangia bacterium]|jgi:acyl carrier protein
MNTHDVELEIRQYLAELHPRRAGDVAALAATAPLFASGLLDSLSFVEFVAFLEQRFGIVAPPADFYQENFGTVAAAAAYVAARTKT